MENKVDLTPFNLLIATPVMDGKVEITYQHSLEYTKRLVEEHGGKCSVIFYAYIADIAYSRAKIFGHFLRNKEFTHLLMIDSDMGWEPKEVAWFLLLKRDFLAAAGPKKKFPIEFAWNLKNDEGKKIALLHETDTNVATNVPFVGGAFLMLSRSCAERLASAYPELQFMSPDAQGDQVDYAIFDPVIIGDKRRLSEDFALCWRWRKIGGEVHVKMDVTLTHTGAHMFTGNLLTHLTSPSNKKSYVTYGENQGF